MDPRTAELADAAQVARAWAAAVGPLAGSVDAGDLIERLRPLALRLVRAVDGTSPDPVDGPGAEVGRTLAAEFSAVPAMLRESLAALAPVLPGKPDAIIALLASLASGFVATLRTVTLAEQEAVRSAAVDAQLRSERRLRASEARFRAVYERAAVGIGLGDLTGRVLDINPAFATMIGHDVETLRGTDGFDLVHPDDRRLLRDLVHRRVAAGRGRVGAEIRLVRADGSARWVDLAVSVVGDGQGRPAYLLAIGEDNTCRHQLAERLAYRARRDTLTGLANRTLFTERLHDTLAAATPGDRIGLCFLDLDGFKIINDSLGHDIGDRLLTAVARRLAEAVTDEHLLARLGGDEFVVLVCDSAGQPQLTTLAERILAALAPPFEVAGQQLSVTASIGVVERDAYGTNPAEVLRAADITLYWAKGAGKGRWAVFDPDRDARQAIRHQLAESIVGALSRDEFSLCYQPVCALSDGGLRLLRASPRWHHPRLGPLAPSDFLGLAEESGLVVPIGRWALRAACAAARDWLDRFGHTPRVSVGIAERLAHDPDLVAHVRAALAEHRVPADRLQLELTERALMGEAPLAALRELADDGVRIVVDDFGTGYSNLTRLRRAPVHGITLAAAFTGSFDIPEGPDRVDLSIARGLVSLARTLTLTVTAGGLTTDRQAARLRELGCEWGIGPRFGAPVPPADIDPLLSR